MGRAGIITVRTRMRNWANGPGISARGGAGGARFSSISTTTRKAPRRRMRSGSAPFSAGDDEIVAMDHRAAERGVELGLDGGGVLAHDAPCIRCVIGDEAPADLGAFH